MPKISYALLTHNEGPLLQALLEMLLKQSSGEEEIVLLDDHSEASTQSILKHYATYPEVQVFSRALARNFAAQRNYLKSACRGEYLFLLDADEQPPAGLLKNRHRLIEFMHANALDGCYFPRINQVTDMHARPYINRRTKSNEDGWFGFPDYQLRVIRNDGKFRWRFRVHEKMFGLKKVYYFPAEEQYSFLHKKKFSHLHNQEIFYRSIPGAFWRKLAKSCAKRLNLLVAEQVVLPAPF